jgi:hypothetical protein
MSNHASPDLIRAPLLDLLEAVITESDDALPEFRRWCEAHIDVLEAIAFDHDHLPTPLSDVLSFEEALAFVRTQLDILDAVRSTTGLDPSGERRYKGMCAMELDLIARISGRE